MEVTRNGTSTHLIALSDRNRVKAAEAGFREAYSKAAWLSEFSTIRLASGRRSGHTTTIKECSKLFTKNLVIVAYPGHASEYPREGKLPVTTICGIDKVAGSTFDAIWVDNASVFDKPDGRGTGQVESSV